MKSSRNLSKGRRALEATARHEAGHALADFILGFKIKKVTIVPDGDYAGTASAQVGGRFSHLSNGHLTSSQIGQWQNKLVTLIAGEAAQRQFDPKGRHAYTSRSDREAINEILRHLHQEPKEASAAYRYLKIRALNLVTAPINRRMIEDLAKRLLEKGTLTGEEVTAEFRSSMRRQREEWKNAA